MEIKIGNHVIKVGENNFQIEYSVKTNDKNIYIQVVFGLRIRIKKKLFSIAFMT
jgi:hypothetical protein